MAAVISKEHDVILDTTTRKVGASRADIVSLDIEPLSKHIGKLESLADELLASLNPSSQPLFSRPSRAGIYKTAGYLTNMAIGFILGCLTFALIVLAYLSATNPATLKALLGG
ncbi:MAG: tetrahydromethanopterin S-methyltransferase subunit B [Candidatus Hecatellales archaeon B24]|nr:MAG: tetrahydromethanopterin S-methyltransferase subunit B [Candidatus Hecatellales archaeon B24]